MENASVPFLPQENVPSVAGFPSPDLPSPDFHGNEGVGMIMKAILVLAMAVGLATARDTEGSCPMDSATDGQILTLRGKVVHAPHDMTLEIAGCGEAVVLVYATDDNGPSHHRTPPNDLERFRTYTNATAKRVGGAICMQCPKYQVEATLTGTLAIATVPVDLTKDNLGFLRDSSGRIVGKVGFGHPIPLYKYQLAIQSASDVAARRMK